MMVESGGLMIGGGGRGRGGFMISGFWCDDCYKHVSTWLIYIQ